MSFRIIKSLAVIASCCSLIVPTGAFAQSVSSQPVYTDTTQMLMRQDQGGTFSQKRLLDRKRLVKRLSADCRPGREDMPEECRRLERQDSQVKNGRAVAKDSGVVQRAVPLSPAAAGATGGVSIGAGTLVASGLVLLFGRYIFSLFSSDDSSSSVSASDATSE